MSEPQLVSTDPNYGASGGTVTPPPPPPADSWRLHKINEQEGPPSTVDKLNEMLGPLAHPQTLTDFATLLTLPVDTVRKAMAKAVTMAAAKGAAAVSRGPVGDAISATGRGVEAVGNSRPARAAEAAGAAEAAWHLDPKGLVLAAAPTVLRVTGRGLQRAGAAVAGAAPAISEVAEAAPAVESAAVAAPAAANALPDQKLLNELAIQARRVGVKLTPQMEKSAVEMVGKGATPAQAVRGFAPMTPAETAPAAPAASVKPRLLATEAKEYKRLLDSGKTHKEAMEMIELERELQERLGVSTPTAAEKRFPKGMRGGSGGD